MHSTYSSICHLDVKDGLDLALKMVLELLRPAEGLFCCMLAFAEEYVFIGRLSVVTRSARRLYRATGAERLVKDRDVACTLVWRPRARRG